jgi:hypothetical protein
MEGGTMPVVASRLKRDQSPDMSPISPDTDAYELLSVLPILTTSKRRCLRCLE